MELVFRENQEARCCSANWEKIRPDYPKCRWVIIRPDVSMCRLGNWPHGRGFSKEEELRTRLLSNKPGGRGATGTVKGLGKEVKTAY